MNTNTQKFNRNGGYCAPCQHSPGQEKILALLKSGARNRKQIQEQADIKSSTNLSRHLQSLTSQGKIKLNISTGEYELYTDEIRPLSTKQP